MRVPQLNERVKEAPAHALRAVFGGIGSLLSVSDKIRNKPAASEAAATAPTAAPETAAAADAVTPDTTATPAMAEPEAPATPEAAVTPDVAATSAPEASVAPETTITPETTAVPEVTAAPAETATSDVTATSNDAAALPLANYDDLSIASLRARLRNLSADQLAQLINYEKAHADRADVISMFERRITKLNLGLTTALPKLTE
jgi:hypothetical protein